jgi:hypothetical protein
VPSRVRGDITAAHLDVLLFLCEGGRGRGGNDERFKRVGSRSLLTLFRSLLTLYRSLREIQEGR